MAVGARPHDCGKGNQSQSVWEESLSFIVHLLACDGGYKATFASELALSTASSATRLQRGIMPMGSCAMIVR